MWMAFSSAVVGALARNDAACTAARSASCDKPVAVAAAHRLLRWLKKEQPSLFLLHPKQVTT